MNELLDFTNAILGSANTISNTVDDYLNKDAQASTQDKEIKLQYAVRQEMMKIRTSSNFENWQDDMNDFFEKVKGDMTNPDSPYYCRNNIQADMFKKVLDQNQLGVSAKVDEMVLGAQREKRIVDTENSMAMYSDLYSGQECVDKQDEAWGKLYNLGDITYEQYNQKKQVNYLTEYRKLRVNAAEALKKDALKDNMTEEQFWQAIKSNMPELKLKGADGMEVYTDMTNKDEQLKKECLSIYNAYKQDMWQQTENEFAKLWDRVQDERTEQGRNAVKKEGRFKLDQLKDTGYMSSEQVIKWTNWLRLEDDLANARGSGSGSSDKITESYEKYIGAMGGEAIEMILKDKTLIPYEAAQAIHNKSIEEWMTVPYKENVGKNYDQLVKTYDDLYEHKTSVKTITDAMLGELKKKYPSAAEYLDHDMKKLTEEIQKFPKEYQGVAVGELADWIVDKMLSEPGTYQDADFKRDFKQHINDCYIERVKYVELNSEGKLEQKFNANKVSDITDAINLANSKDYAFTDQRGVERFTAGRKEALEAPGGIVNVFQNAVVGTLNIPESEYKNIGFYYKPDEKNYDMTSTPIVTYKDKAYELIANNDGKGFTVREYAVDQNGKMQAVRDIEGKTGGKLKQVMRANQKQEAKQVVKESAEKTAQIKKQRKLETEKAITESKTMPKAMKATGQFEQDEWDTINVLEERQYRLNVTINKIDKDANKVKDNEMTAEEFKKKYNIDYDTWIQDAVRDRRYELILKS